MTEAEWWTTTEHNSLGHWLFQQSGVRGRKARLFTLACCRLIECFLPDWRPLTPIDVLEDVAEGRISTEDLEQELRSWPEVEYSGTDFASMSADGALQAALTSGTSAGMAGPYYVALRADDVVTNFDSRPSSSILDLLHDIFGPLPFRDVVVDPAWRTSTAVAIARGMYESRDFSAMPILADALQDAGCDSDDILNHCRDPKQTHVRGCWAVDLVLGKA